MLPKVESTEKKGGLLNERGYKRKKEWVGEKEEGYMESGVTMRAASVSTSSVMAYRPIAIPTREEPVRISIHFKKFSKNF